MKKSISVVILAFLLLAGCSQKSVWFEGSFEDAGKNAEANGKLLLVDFYSPG